MAWWYFESKTTIKNIQQQKRGRRRRKHRKRCAAHFELSHSEGLLYGSKWNVHCCKDRMCTLMGVSCFTLSFIYFGSLTFAFATDSIHSWKIWNGFSKAVLKAAVNYDTKTMHLINPADGTLLCSRRYKRESIKDVILFQNKKKFA